MSENKKVSVSFKISDRISKKIDKIVLKMRLDGIKTNKHKLMNELLDTGLNEIENNLRVQVSQ